MIEFYEKFEIVNTTQEIASDCNSLTVVNIGGATAVLNGLEIPSGDQYYAPGNESEFNTTRYRLSFTGVGSNLVLIIRKIYK